MLLSYPTSFLRFDILVMLGEVVVQKFRTTSYPSLKIFLICSLTVYLALSKSS